MHCHKAEMQCPVLLLYARELTGLHLLKFMATADRAQIRVDQQAGLQFDPTLKVQLLQGI